MTIRFGCRSWLVLLLLLPVGRLQAQEGDQELAKAGFAVMKKHCYQCHGVQFNGNAQLNVLVRESLVSEESSYVVAGKADDSYLWQRIEGGEMPPEKSPQLSEDEKDTVKRWIEAGLPFPEVDTEKKTFKTYEAMLRDIRAHLQKSKTFDRPFQRYFTLTHLYNNPMVSPADYRLYQAAFSKALNSVSWEPEIVVPMAIDEEQSIFVVDLREVGFDENDVWKSVLQKYPYGLSYDQGKNQDLRDLAREVEELSGTELAHIRADWFAFNATQPPLYHTLARIPATAAELERELKVDVEADFLKNNLQRAGFTESGVSSQNRLVDRHSATYGMYWKSYDFAANDGNKNLFRFPLGPAFIDNPFPQFTFEHDGGEIIFSLPNGLQGYMLTDGQDQRIDKGPTNVVADAVNRTAGTVEVTNGISCMNCHKHGMIRFKDTVRDSVAVSGTPLEKVQALFTEQDVMNVSLKRDEERFLAALDKAIGPFLRVGDDKDRDIREFPEPIGNIARFYYRDVSVDEATFELGFEDPKLLEMIIPRNSELTSLGLLPLANGATIKRDLWESQNAVISPFQEAARELDVGTPLLFLGK